MLRFFEKLFTKKKSKDESVKCTSYCLNSTEIRRQYVIPVGKPSPEEVDMMKKLYGEKIKFNDGEPMDPDYFIPTK